MFTQHCPVYPCNCARCSSVDGLEPGIHYAKRGAVKSVARKGWLSMVVVTIGLVSSVASADARKPGRCVLVSEPDRAVRMVCDVPPSEGCATATMVRPDTGEIVTRKLCVYTATR